MSNQDNFGFSFGLESIVYHAINDAIDRENKRTGGTAPHVKYGYSFTKEELSHIKQLEVKNTDLMNLSELSQIPNLEDLVLDYQFANHGTRSVGQTVSNRGFALTNKTDYSAIENIKSLEWLSIKGQPSLETFDVSKLPNLTMLELSNNTALKKVSGLDKITKLENLTMCGSKNLSAFDFGEVRRANKLLYDCKFDMSMFPSFMKKSLDFPNQIKQQDANDLIKVRFIERHSHTNGQTEYAAIPSGHALRTYEKALSVVKNVTSAECTDYENFYGIYNWVINNIQYDKEGLANESAQTPGSYAGRSILTNKSDSIRSSFNAMNEHKVVCAGYSNLMVLLGQCANLDITYVSCNSDIKNEAGILESNHAIIKARMGDKTYYCDPTSDASSHSLRFFLKNKEEIGKTHNLSYLENQEDNSRPLTNEEKNYITSHYRETHNKAVAERTL